MKKLISICIVLLSLRAAAQSPVKWQYTITKKDAKSFELHMKATMPKGWHIYAQQQPQDAIAVPTRFNFRNNPLLLIEGTPLEQGRKETQVLKDIDITQYHYADEVVFVQKITLKAAVKTTVTGSVTFEACTDKQCLPAKEESFSVELK